MVPFPSFSFTPFKTPDHNSTGRDNTIVRNIEGLQDECDKNYREFHSKLLPKQIQGYDPTPSNNHKAMHLRRCQRNLGRRGKMS